MAGSDGECGWVWRLRLGWGRRGAGGELGCQPAGSAACAASDWAGTSGAAVGVGCRVRVRDGRARSAPLGVTALPSCCVSPPNPHLAQKSPRLGATLRSITGRGGPGGGGGGDALMVQLWLFFHEEKTRGRVGWGLCWVPEGSRVASLTPHQVNHGLYGTPIKPSSACGVDPIPDSCDPARVRWDHVLTALQGPRDAFATSMKVWEWEACRCVIVSVSPGASCSVDWLLEERNYLPMETIVFELCHLGN